MKKVAFCLAAMAMMAMAMTSCQKEKNIAASDITFTATTESNAKTHLEGLNLRWDNEGESIEVSDGVNHYTYTASAILDNNTRAVFDYHGQGTFTTNDYHVYYPASIYQEDGSVFLPYSSCYEDGVNGLSGFPMYAETTDGTFRFNNLCGLLRIHLQQTGVSIKSIHVQADQPLRGNFDVVAAEDGKFVLSARSGQGNIGASLVCNQSVDISNGAYFDIYLAPGEYSTFSITVIDNNGSKFYKCASEPVTINRNEVVTLDFENNMEFTMATVDVGAPSYVKVTIDGASHTCLPFVVQHNNDDNSFEILGSCNDGVVDVVLERVNNTTAKIKTVLYVSMVDDFIFNSLLSSWRIYEDQCLSTDVQFDDANGVLSAEFNNLPNGQCVRLDVKILNIPYSLNVD